METAAQPRTVARIWALTSAGTAVWLASIFLAPWLAGHGQAMASRFLYAVFAPLCHQIPDRCFHLNGLPLAVCGRCLGIYAGFAAGLLAYPLVRGFSRLSLPSVRLLLALTLPMAVDAGGGILGLWRTPIGLRFATGLAWGSILPYYFIAGVADFFRAWAERREGRRLDIAGSKK